MFPTLLSLFVMIPLLLRNIQLTSFRRLLPLVSALPQGGFKDPDPEVPDFGDTPGKYCLCLRPVDGQQDPEPTAQVCPQFAQYGAFATEIEFGGPGGGYFGAVRIIFSYRVAKAG